MSEVRPGGIPKVRMFLYLTKLRLEMFYRRKSSFDCGITEQQFFLSALIIFRKISILEFLADFLTQP